ncbi:MAG TPA: hypothetical protein DCG12_13675 [Planctomycetaceae bacterium]|nr:hypothetical protein [Planctomycetaceae bacterium]
MENVAFADSPRVDASGFHAGRPNTEIKRAPGNRYRRFAVRELCISGPADCHPQRFDAVAGRLCAVP